MKTKLFFCFLVVLIISGCDNPPPSTAKLVDGHPKYETEKVLTVGNGSVISLFLEKEFLDKRDSFMLSLIHEFDKAHPEFYARPWRMEIIQHDNPDGYLYRIFVWHEPKITNRFSFGGVDTLRIRGILFEGK